MVGLPDGRDMPENAEFSVGNAYQYDRRSAVRWIFSHVFRFKRFLFGALACQLVSIVMFTLAPVLIGQAVDVIMHPGPAAALALNRLALGVLAALIIDGAANMAAAFCVVNISNGIAASARTELYA